MKICFPAVTYALAMIVLATAARLGLVDRDAAAVILLILPLVAFTAIMAGRRDHCSISVS
ncbi:MAG: hypothetical protein ABIR63_04710 [Sphingomicrobium sp.]